MTAQAWSVSARAVYASPVPWGSMMHPRQDDGTHGSQAPTATTVIDSVEVVGIVGSGISLGVVGDITDRRTNLVRLAP